MITHTTHGVLFGTKRVQTAEGLRMFGMAWEELQETNAAPAKRRAHRVPANEWEARGWCPRHVNFAVNVAADGYKWARRMGERGSMQIHITEQGRRASEAAKR